MRVRSSGPARRRRRHTGVPLAGGKHARPRHTRRTLELGRGDQRLGTSRRKSDEHPFDTIRMRRRRAKAKARRRAASNRGPTGCAAHQPASQSNESRGDFRCDLFDVFLSRPRGGADHRWQSNSGTELADVPIRPTLTDVSVDDQLLPGKPPNDAPASALQPSRSGRRSGRWSRRRRPSRPCRCQPHRRHPGPRPSSPPRPRPPDPPRRSRRRNHRCRQRPCPRRRFRQHHPRYLMPRRHLECARLDPSYRPSRPRSIPCTISVAVSERTRLRIKVLRVAAPQAPQPRRNPASHVRSRSARRAPVREIEGRPPICPRR